MLLQSLAGLPAFLAYFCTAFIIVVLYLVIYTRATAYDEFELIRNNVPGAAIALGLSLLGFALPVASAIAHAQNLLDCAVWSLIALIVQLAIHFVVRIPVPDLQRRMAQGELAAAIWLGLASLAGGTLNAACMTY
jgi:putative membrane protein